MRTTEAQSSVQWAVQAGLIRLPSPRPFTARGTVRNAIEAALNRTGRVSTDDIIAAGATHSAGCYYLKKLLNEGKLRVVRPKRTGIDGHAAIYGRP